MCGLPDRACRASVGYVVSVEPNDTSDRARQQQIELLRTMTPGQRAALALRLTDNAIALSRRAIARAHPEWSELEVKIEWARIHYGPQISAWIERRMVASE